MSKKRNSDGAEPDMTPMIDVVFQLIIFFIVTINLSDAKDETVRLELGVHGHPVESGADSNVSALLIDVARNGRCSIANQTLKLSSLRDIVRRRLSRQGNSFQVWIRGDARAQHTHIRRVMDTCTEAGVGRVTFIAVKDPRTQETKDFLASRSRR